VSALDHSIGARTALRAFVTIGIALIVAAMNASWLWSPQTAEGSVVASQSAISVALARSLSLRASDLPAGWTSDGDAGKCITGASSTANISDCRNTEPASERVTDTNFAKCVGVPVSHISMIVGEDEQGEPFTYASSSYTAPSVPGSNPELLPRAQTYVTIERSKAAQASDLAAFSKTTFPDCFKIEESALFDGISTFAEAEGSTFTIGPLQRVSTPSTSGVSVVGYVTLMTFRGSKFRDADKVSMIIMGAAQIEEVVDLQSWSNSPFSTTTAEDVVTRLEKRLSAFAHIG
jgi:hypothetical protein